MAENIYECNISVELAEFNGLSIGDEIELKDFYPIELEIVGIYSDNSEELSKELNIISDKLDDNGYTIFASRTSISRNHILTTLNSLADISTWYPWEAAYNTVVYYMRNEQSIPAFIELIEETLPWEYAVFDSLDVMRYVRTIIDRTANSFRWLLLIFGTVSLVFITLILFHILKMRTYDIGVFRAKGMPRARVSVILALEVFIVFSLAFIAAVSLYFTAFSKVAGFMYGEMQAAFSRDSYGLYSIEAVNAGREYIYTAQTGILEFGMGFAALSLFALALTASVTLFISRHEPMKTMTRY
jgi:hypothetical protein